MTSTPDPSGAHQPGTETDPGSTLGAREIFDMKVTFINGPLSIEVENGDATNVGDLIAELREQGVLGADGTPTVLRNGGVANAADELEDGDEIAVTKPAGQKGARKS